MFSTLLLSLAAFSFLNGSSLELHLDTILSTLFLKVSLLVFNKCSFVAMLVGEIISVQQCTVVGGPFMVIRNITTCPTRRRDMHTLFSRPFEDLNISLQRKLPIA